MNWRMSRRFGWIWLLAVMAAIGVTLAGCSGNDKQAKVGSTPVIEGGSAAAVVQIGDVENHPNGTQVRLDRITFGKDATLVDLGVTNGHDDRISFQADETAIRFGNSSYRQLQAGGTDELTVDAYSDAQFALRFPAAPEGTDQVTVGLNRGPLGDAASDPGADISTSPQFSFGPYSTSQSQQLKPLPKTLAVPTTASHPNGTHVELHTIGFSPNRIGVSFKASFGGNAASDHEYLNEFDGTYAVDDLGNRYPLVPSESNGELKIDRGASLDGVAVFAGRINPDAAELRIVFNDAPEGDAATDPGADTSDIPQFKLGPYRLDGATAGSKVVLPQPLAPNDVQNHPNGTQIEVTNVGFNTDTMTATIKAEFGGNDASDHAYLNEFDGTYAVDDLGNRYPLLPPSDNKDLKIAEGAELRGTLVFTGRINDKASTIQFVINDSPEGDAATGPGADTSDIPQFKLGPYHLVRNKGGGGPVAASTPPLSFGLRTAVGAAELQASIVEQVKIAASQFNGKEINGGVQFTVPANVLFDFDKTDLRPDAQAAVQQLSTVLQYYAGAPAQVLGYTDSKGSDPYNLDLSSRRANAVVDALVGQYGIDRSRLTPEGKGEADPVAPNENSDGSDNPAGRQQNRRVVVVIKTDKGLPH